MPDGKDGDIEYPLAFVAPPLLVGVTIRIGVPAVTDWIGLESEIRGASVASIVVKDVPVDCLPANAALVVYLISK